LDLTIPIIILQLIVLEGLLSIDNAAVLGTMVTHLPSDQPVEWPLALRPLGAVLNPLLGMQRLAALRAGLFGAYVMRGLMLLMASIIIQNPWLKALGALYLLRLAFDNLGVAEPGEADAHAHPTSDHSFWAVVLTVELTDLVFSLDNVVAAISLSNKLWVVMVGVAIGILVMRFAAGLFSYAVEREPVLKAAAYLLVFNIGVELLLEEWAGIHITDLLRFSISIGTVLLALAYSHFAWLRVLRPVVLWVGEGFANINELIDWLLVPVLVLLKILWNIVRFPFTRRTATTAGAAEKEGID
jgi:tellurite resistance protein TerC